MTRFRLFSCLLAVCLAAWGCVAVHGAPQSPPISADLTSDVEAGVVYIHAEWKDQDGAIDDSWGSGFFVSDTEIITNHHVIEEAIERPGTRITIRTHSGTSDTKRYEAYVNRRFEDADLALLTVRNKPEGVEPLPISAVLPAKNALVMSFGFPMGDLFDPSPNGPGVALRRGYVSRLTHADDIIEADMNIDHGMSGGPAIDSNGLVVGVVQAMGGSSDNPAAFAFLISANALMRFLNDAGSEVRPVHPAAVEGDEDEEPAEGPKAGEKSLRQFFSLGSALRVETLITKIMRDTEGKPDADRMQTAQMNAANVARYLRELEAPDELVQQAEAVTGMFGEDANMEDAAVAAQELEKATDGWVVDSAEGLEKVNYDLGAWLLEMRVGLIDAARDQETCRGFQRVGELQKAPAPVMDLLKQINEALVALDEERSVSGKDVIAKAAEKLIAIGLLAPAREESATEENGDGIRGRPGVNMMSAPIL